MQCCINIVHAGLNWLTEVYTSPLFPYVLKTQYSYVSSKCCMEYTWANFEDFKIRIRCFANWILKYLLNTFILTYLNTGKKIEHHAH